MIDVALRQVERALALEPASVELRRQHAQLLRRAGREEESLAALDLAWRLGADDLWGELQARLAERLVDADSITLCYVPAGPFAMGADDFDLDAQPVHRVDLSAFYVAAEPLTRAQGREQDDPPPSSWDVRYPIWADLARASAAVAALERRLRPQGLPPAFSGGRWALISEAQWERVFRASYLLADRDCPYGVTRPEVPEWTADAYLATAYARGPALDPRVEGGEQRVVRGVPAVPDPHWASYREAVGRDGRFTLAGGDRVAHEAGLRVRVVFLPTPAAAPG